MPALEPALRAFFFWPPPLARASSGGSRINKAEGLQGLPGGDPIRGGTGNARPGAGPAGFLFLSRLPSPEQARGGAESTKRRDYRDYLAVIPFGGGPAMPALEPTLRAFFFYARPPASSELGPEGGHKKRPPVGGRLQGALRRRRDSNPRYLAVRRFSRPVHSTALPLLRKTVQTLSQRPSSS